MRLNILPVQYGGLDCQDGLLLSLVEWLNRDNSSLFAEAWNFDFAPEIQGYPNTIGDRLFVCNVVSKELLKDYCGIGSHEIYNSDISLDKFMPLLKKELSEGRPILIIYDLFWCPWSKDYYQKVHAPIHRSLVTGFVDAGLICMEYAYKDPETILPYDHFNPSIHTFVTFNITPEPPKVDFTFQQIMDKVVSATNRFDTFNTIRRFGRYVKECFDPVKEMERFGIDNFNANPLNWQIERIASSRKLFASTLRVLSKKYNLESLLELASNLELVIPKWLTIMSMIIKSCIASNTNSLGRISDKIIELADLEESIFNCLVKISQNPSVEMDIQSVLKSSKNNQGELPLNVWHADLTAYCNNRAFDSHEGCTYIPDFSGDSFILKDENICNRSISAHNISFKLTDILADVYDNVLCKGQVIELPENNYKKIALLGCSTNGNYSGGIKVHYTDGHLEARKVELSDCYPGGAEYEQDILWVGQCSKDLINKTDRFTCQLYGQFFDLSYRKNACSITLPDCPEMHIFAISLQY